ncbi:hypothetical protein ISN75_19895 [Dyella marensis]|uniref:hypothetical protein n=1 Tax=Dyella marensis TaxID=500610 RepID=UPI0031DEA368
MKRVFLAVALYLGLGCTLSAFADEAWLQGASMQDQGDRWKILPAASYLDLGNDSDAINKLAEAKFLLDPSVSGKSLSLKCAPPSRRYLIRSLYYSDSNVIIYGSANAVIIGAGSFSEPHAPSKGAVAICLNEAPKDVRATVSFAR